MHLPILDFNSDSTIDSVQNFSDKSTIIITDSYNYEIFKYHFKNIIHISDNDVNQINRIKDKYKYSKVIAIGGCTALDIGRAISKNNKLILFPSILSTSCISVNRSVLNKKGIHFIIKTQTPYKTIINLPLIIQTSKDELYRWSSSGLGDFISNLSAIIDYVSINNQLNIKYLKQNQPYLFWAFKWLEKIEHTINEDFIINLATLLHQSSVDVIQRDSLLFSSAGEHKLFHIMKEKFKYKEKDPTHGQLVALGTLISVKIFCEITKSNNFFDYLKDLYKKWDLPYSYNTMNKIGIRQKELILGLRILSNNYSNTFLGNYFRNKSNFNILDNIFVE